METDILNCDLNNTARRRLFSGYAGALELWEWSGRLATGKTLLALPNGYGVLSYLSLACKELSSIYTEVYALNYRGQGNSEGLLSIAGAGEDIVSSIELLDKPIDILVHCSGILPLLVLDKNHGIWKNINRVVLYGYLAKPSLHYNRFCRKAERYGVRFDDILEDLSQFDAASYSSLPVPISVIHPLNQENLRRASREELAELCQHASVQLTLTPMDGYAISDKITELEVQSCIKESVAPALSTPQRTVEHL